MKITAQAAPTAPRHVIGIDLGGTNVRAVVGDAQGRIIGTAAVPTERSHAAATIAQLAALSREAAQNAAVHWSSIDAVAIGVPGVAHGGTLTLAPNLPPFDNLDIVAELEDALSVAIAVDNDVNMAAVGEHRRGVGEGLADLVFIAVGTGIGMGIISGGELQRGSAGAAGEISDLPIGLEDMDGLVPGYFEEITGGAGIARRYVSRRGSDDQAVTAHDVYRAARHGDGDAMAVLDEQATAAAYAAAVAATILDPELIVFGGGIGARVDFVDRVRERLPHFLPRGARIGVSSLGERAGAVGAAEVARLVAARRTSRDSQLGLAPKSLRSTAEVPARIESRRKS